MTEVKPCRARVCATREAPDRSSRLIPRLEGHDPEITFSTLRLFRGILPIFSICRIIYEHVHLYTLDTETLRGLVPVGALDTMIIDPSHVRKGIAQRCAPTRRTAWSSNTDPDATPGGNTTHGTRVPTLHPYTVVWPTPDEAWST